MRLLNRLTGSLEYFPDRPFPPYAILSHTWGSPGTEITFRDMREGLDKTKKASYEKMKNTCLRAEEDSIMYVWIDTFCIDKESSAELSESINSMFLWYKEAKVCYAFMADVSSSEDAQKSAEFAQSKWFKRGWTLQELIAPKDVIFYSKDWKRIGTKKSLAGTISHITRIDEGILTGVQDLKHTSIAKRMSWASERVTTRQEDIAYCLMGLFNINMAMLYGEGGEKAFRRLQEQIMQDSDDETLFAWTDHDAEHDDLRGLLAKSPKDFLKSRSYLPNYDGVTKTPHSITSRGLCITLGLVQLDDDIWVGSLESPVPPTYSQTLAIYLKLLDKQTQQYARIKSQRLCEVPLGAQLQTIYIRQQPLLPGFDDIYLHHAFQTKSIKVFEEDSSIAQDLDVREYSLDYLIKHPLSSFISPLPTRAPQGIPLKAFVVLRGDQMISGIMIIQRPDKKKVLVMLGSKPGSGIVVDVALIPDAVIQLGNLTAFFAQLESLFEPHPPGSWFDMEYDRFQVNVQARPHEGIHYYMVDVVIQEVKHLPSPQEILHAIPEIVDTVRKPWWRWGRNLR